MKKIFLFILMCFCFTSVQAKEYSEYSDYSDYTDEVITSSDLIDVKKERRYKYYKLNKVLGPYKSLLEENDEFPYTDLEDFEYTEESEYLNEIPEVKEGRVINEYEGLHYRKVKDINRIKIINQNDYGNRTWIYSFALTYNGVSIPYEIKYVNGDKNGIEAGGYIIIELENNYVLKDIDFSFIAECGGENGSNVLIQMLSDDLLVSDYGKKCSGYLLMCFLYSRAHVYPDGYDHYYTTNPLNNMSFMGNVTLYTYKDILYRKYNLEKEYYDDYLSSPYEDYIYKDELDYKDYYAYRTRALIESDNPFSLENKPLVIQNTKLTVPNTLDNNKLVNFDYMPLSNKIVKGNRNIDINDGISLKKIPLFILLLGIIILFLSKQYKKYS